MKVRLAEGVELFVERVGRGVPVMAVHGVGLDHTYFRPWLDGLGDRAELIYFDQRGCGRSDRPASYEGIDHASWADDIDALREALGLEKIVLFGHSQGGFLALDYALRHPGRLQGLILCGAAPALDYADQILAAIEARATPEQREAAMRLFTRPFASDEDMLACWETMLPLYFHRWSDETARTLFADILPSAGAWNHCNGACLPGWSVLERLPEIEAPVLVISGTDDFVTPTEQGARRLHERLPNAELLLFEECGHYPFVEKTGAFLEGVRSWLGARVS